MQLLRNNSKKTATVDRQPEQQGAKVTGLAATFDSGEVKKLFFGYLITILSIEGLILFLSYINLLATSSSTFPWKPYLFATFIAPIATTFIFGLILLTFNRFFFNESPPVVDNSGLFSPGLGSNRVDFFFHTVHRLPFLFSMLLLIVATALAYKLDVIVIYMAQVGASTAQYLFFTLIGLLVATAVGIAIWMILSYRLRQKSLQTGHQYRMQLMEQFEMVLLDDGTMINKKGDVVYQQDGTAQLFHSEAAENLRFIEGTEEIEEE